jgi:hypothetical protein
MLTRPNVEIIVGQGERDCKEGNVLILYILTAVKMYFVLKGLKHFVLIFENLTL